MEVWYIYSIWAFLFWGLWAFFIKLSEKYFSTGFIFFVYGTIYFLFTVILSFLFFKDEINKPILNLGLIFILFAVITSLLANLFFYHSLSKGNASLVVSLTALYPLVTIILSLLILNERPSTYQMFGMGLALIAGVLLSL